MGTRRNFRGAARVTSRATTVEEGFTSPHRQRARLFAGL